jgi:hypothetical protein
MTINITLEYIWDLLLEQNRKCALTGLPLTFAKDYNKSTLDQTASLDRIDSSVGYIIGNVQWVHKEINKIKREFK